MNKDNYKRELDNVKPDEKLVRDTINLIEKRQEEKQRKSIFTFQRLAVGFCSILVIGSVGYTYYNTNNGSRTISSEESNKQYAVSTTYNIEEQKEAVTSNINAVVSSNNNGVKIDRDQNWVPSKRIGFNKETENTFTGMYLISESDNTNWKNYRHTKEYNDFKKFINMLDAVASEKTIKFKKTNSYKNSDIIIYDTYGKSYATKNTMRVKIGNKYMIYLPVLAEDTIVVQLLGANDIAVYEIKRDMSKEDEYIKLRDFVKNTGVEIIEDKQESIDRNIKVIVNGKEDKTKYYEGNVFDDETSHVRVRYTLNDKKLYIKLKNNYTEITEPKVTFDKEIEISSLHGKVKDIIVSYIGQDSYPYIIILTNDANVYCIKTSDWVRTGTAMIEKITQSASSIERGTDENGYSKIYATVNGKKVKLDIK